MDKSSFKDNINVGNEIRNYNKGYKAKEVRAEMWELKPLFNGSLLMHKWLENWN